MSVQPEIATVALALVGAGIGGSLTPAMQEREGAAAGLALTYDKIDAEVQGFGAEDLPRILAEARRSGLAGLNITHPFKQAVLPLLDEVSEDARDLGAVNTIVFDGDRAIGHNTDWSGWGRAFRRVLPSAVNDRVVLVGSGGAGAAVGYALLEQGAEWVRVVDVEVDRAQRCVERLSARFGAGRVEVATSVAEALTDAQGLVNATPVGMIGHEGLSVPEEAIQPHLWVSDVVYFPLETQLIRLARERGCRVVTGGGMAVYQAVGAFELFTGHEADADRMLGHFAELNR